MLRTVCRIAIALALLGAAPNERGTKAMDSVKLERLGDVEPFRDTNSWLRSKALEPIPIILWQGSEIAAAFYYEWKGSFALSSFEQKIAPLEKRPRKPLGSVFPLRYSGRPKEDRGESSIAAFDVKHLQVADLDGDGVDELVLPRHLGSVEVFNLRGRALGGVVPGTNPQHFSYEVVSSQKVRAGGKDAVYLVYRREPFKSGEAPAQSSPADTVLEVTAAGVRAVPIMGLPAELDEILGVGPRSRPGSQQVDELVVLSRLKGRDGESTARSTTRAGESWARLGSCTKMSRRITSSSPPCPGATSWPRRTGRCSRRCSSGRTSR